MDFELKHNKRSRSIKLRVDVDGSLKVTAPPKAPLDRIQQFVRQNQDWIKRQQQKLKLKQDIYPTIDWENQLISVLGLVYSFRFDTDADSKVIKDNGVIRVAPITLEEDHVKPTLLKWLKKTAEDHFGEKVPYWAQQMSADYKSLRFRQQKSRWGSCSSSGTLSFNWRLIHFSPDVIDYVIIHELAHTKHMDHSERFWSLVAKHDPHYKQKVKFLKQQVIRMEKL